MSVLDAVALIGLLLDEPSADAVTELLRGSAGMPMASGLTIAELADVLVRRGRLRVDEVSQSIDLLAGGGLEIVPVDAEVGFLAGVLRSRHWNPRSRPVSMADCVALATAMTAREPLATADAALLATARAEGHPVIPLPDSQGRMPA